MIRTRNGYYRGRLWAVLVICGIAACGPAVDIFAENSGSEAEGAKPVWSRSAAQQIVAADPDDPVYEKLDSWICAGLIDEPFMLRPYSPEIIAQMLENVIERGGPLDRAQAGELLAYIRSAYLEMGERENSSWLFKDGCMDEYFGESALTLRLAAKVGEGLWIGGRTGMSFADQSDADAPLRLCAPGERPANDLINDGGRLPIIGFNGNELFCRLYIISNAGYAKGNFWTQSGLTRSSYGPFFGNGIVLGPQAPAAPNWSAHWRFNKWRYSMQLMNLTKSAVMAGASTGGPDSDVVRESDKFLMFHSFSWSPCPNVDLGLFESVVWADRFEPIYILPFANYFAIQSLTSFNDNSLAGVYGTLRLPGRTMAKAQIYIDDIDFNNYINFDFDSKLLAAGEIGLDWAPDIPCLKLLSTNYTIVTPYMYTHKYDGSSQDDYTQDGCCLGAELLPNSDRVEVKARIMPAGGDNLSIEALIRLIRHGNASESYGGTGGLFDNGWAGSSCSYDGSLASSTSPKYFRFLSQSTLEKTWEVGAGASYRLNLDTPDLLKSCFGPASSLTLSARYVFAYVQNADLEPGVNEWDHYLSAGAEIWL